MGVIAGVAREARSRERNLCNLFFPVTGLASQSRMRASQLKTCLFVVIKLPARPSIWRMTQGAIASQAAFVMGIAMATRACHRRILERRSLVALFARHDRVLPEKGEVCEIVVVSAFQPPAILVVALLAVSAKLPLMSVIFLMTGDAGGSEFVLVEVAGMATVTADVCVPSSERKFRSFRVIETDCLPFDRLMTGVAFRAIAALMNVLELMT